MLKDGSESQDPRLDRIYEEDWNSLNYPLMSKMTLTRDFSTYAPRSYTWGIAETLDQGREGACVGFGFAHDLLARPQVIKDVVGVPVDSLFAKQRIYWEAQKIDEWGGGSYPGAAPFYEGTSVLAGAKILQREGLYDSYYWGLSLHETAIGLGYDGPCVFGINWYEGMYDTDANGFIHPTGELVGGHAILVMGVRVVWKHWYDRFISRRWDNVDLDRSYFTLKNSWGPSWGYNGFCKLAFRDAERLLNEQGDACFPKRKYI